MSLNMIGILKLDPVEVRVKAKVEDVVIVATVVKVDDAVGDTMFYTIFIQSPFVRCYTYRLPSYTEYIS